MRVLGALLALYAAPPGAALAQRGESLRLESLKGQIRREEDRFQRLEQRIAEERDRARQSERQATSLLRQLDSISARLAVEDERYRLFSKRLSESEIRLRILNGRRTQLAQKQRERKAQLRRRIRAMYMEGPVGPVRLLINASSVWDALERWSLLRLLGRHDVRLIESYRREEALIQGLEDLYRKEVIRQSEIRAAQAKAKQRIAVIYTRRTGQLARLAKDKEKRESFIRELAGARDALRDTIVSLMRSREMRQAGRASPLEEMRGRLPWPVVEPKPGARKRSGRGLQIEAPSGASIRPVAAGEIVFSDWVRGYGRLVVLRHPGDFYTVYGGAGEVFVDKGDRVNPATIIARVGTTDAMGQSALYFEIRKGAIPLDPLKWLMGRR
ncbi:MAG: peptidoglycan DD-metalloendopeptidase family protein [bacterium]|nr:peptidoglycan DD-metalloendopeptidase family protein [bacterium]